MTQLLCSVVIPTFNRSESVLRLLDSLTIQDLPLDSFEVVVVDDGSSDETWQRLCQVRVPFELRIFTQANQGPAAARNSAIREARSDLIIMLDDDVIAQPGVLREHVAAHAADPGIAAIGVMAPMAKRRMKPWAQWELRALEKQYDAMLQGAWAATPRQFYTANASVSRRAIIDAGLFDTYFRRSEDMELAYRLRQSGVRFQFLPDAVVFHDPPRSFRAWKTMAHGLGFYELEIWRRFGNAELYAQVRREFQWRPASVRQLVRLLVGRRLLLTPAVWSASVGAALLHLARLERMAHLGYSAMFQLLYWQGACDSMGSRRELLGAADRRHSLTAAAESGQQQVRG